MSNLLKIVTFISLSTFVTCSLAENTGIIGKVLELSFLSQNKYKKDSYTKKSNTKPIRKKEVRNKQKHAKTKKMHKPYIHHIHKTVPDFDKLLVGGNINVELHSGYSKPSIVIIGDRRDLASIMTKVQSNALVLYAGAGVPSYAPVKVVVKGRYIHGIKLKTNASIKGHKLKLNHLNLDVDDHAYVHLGGYLMANRIRIRGHGRVKLEGVRSKHLEVCLEKNAHLEINGKANLAKLEASGHSHFSMTWVDSWDLIANIKGNAYVQLAGVANKLDACVFDNAYWNGRYLRSRRTFMKTYDHALARISAVKKQHTLALDQSNIYFYNLSTYRTDFMAYNGSVLDMRSWRLRSWHDYDHYNKAG